MSARRELSNIRKIEILCDEEAPGDLCGLPDLRVGAPAQPLGQHRVGVEANCSKSDAD